MRTRYYLAVAALFFILAVALSVVQFPYADQWVGPMVGGGVLLVVKAMGRLRQ